MKIDPLPQKRMSKAAAEAWLKRTCAENELVMLFPIGTFTGETPSRFAWNEDVITCDFFAGKLRRISLERSEFDRFVNRVLDGDEFALIESWVPNERGEPVSTEFVGTAWLNQRENGPAIKRGWNDFNEMCNAHFLGRVRELTGEFNARRYNVALAEVIAWSEKAWARITDDQHVYYFLPQERQEGSWRVHVVNRTLRAMPVIVNDRAMRPVRPEVQEYLEVAWDTYESGGGRAPLRGLPASGGIPQSSLSYAAKKLEKKMQACGVTKAQLREGMKVEREHADVTKRGVEKTARIALAHLCERPDYYKRLKKYVER